MSRIYTVTNIVIKFIVQLPNIFRPKIKGEKAGSILILTANNKVCFKILAVIKLFNFKYEKKKL